MSVPISGCAARPKKGSRLAAVVLPGNEAALAGVADDKEELEATAFDSRARAATVAGVGADAGGPEEFIIWAMWSRSRKGPAQLSTTCSSRT